VTATTCHLKLRNSLQMQSNCIYMSPKLRNSLQIQSNYIYVSPKAMQQSTDTI